MMFECEDRQTLQTLLNNETTILEHQKIPWHMLDVIVIAIKSEDHFWNFWGDLLSDVCQRPDEGFHALNTWITTLVNQCKFSDLNTKEMLKIMVLQHAAWYCKVQDWIHQEDQYQLTYQALLSQCQFLESCCEVFQKAKEKGHVELTSLSTASSIHQDVLLAYSKCPHCGYYHSLGTCPAHGKECYRCRGHNNFTALCWRRPQRSFLGSRAKSPRDADTSPQCRHNQPSKRQKTGHLPEAPPTGTLEHLPAVPPTVVPTAPAILTESDITGDPYPSATTRTASW